MLLGGDGVISVTSNIVPDVMHKMMMAALKKDKAATEAMNKPLELLHQVCVWAASRCRLCVVCGVRDFFFQMLWYTPDFSTPPLSARSHIHHHPQHQHQQRLFLQSNPIPAKWALWRMGKIGAGIRPPMTVLEEEFHKPLEEALKAAGAI